MAVYGVVKPIPAGQTAPGNQELVVDYYEIVGHSPAGGADTLLNEVSTMMKYRIKISIMLVCFQ